MDSRACSQCAMEIAEDWGHPVCPRCLLGDAISPNLPTTISESAATTARAPNPEETKSIGRYQVRRVIASGGMGTVFEATQENPRRTVAVKVMRQGIASPAAMRRFEYEAQLLGGLRHPGIAQIFEAGTYDDSGVTVPFFAMEYIPGAKALTEYADSNALGTKERLELFAGVCDAVHHGHQKGVIHRDLKPGNILVDSSGFAKVIDFGVARSTDSDVAATTMHTSLGQLVGTLQYMSPEQVLADPADLDIRSDVYSLGVVLYELLCGRAPYDLRKLPLLEATRVIREAAPERPRSVVTSLRGDVETIALKALEKDREQRYQSAHELASDIRRHIRGEAIHAQPPTVVYQVRIFIRRNKALVGAVAAVFAVLLGAAIVSTSLYLRAEAARATAAKERDAAEAVTNYLRSTLASVDPRQARGREVTVREVLDRSAAQIATAFPGQPTVEAAVRDTLGSTYMGLGLFDRAEPQLSASLALRRTEFGEANELTLSSLLSLAELRWSQGRFDEAEKLSRNVLDAQRKTLGPEHRDALGTMGLLGQILRDYGKNEEAERIFRNTLELQRRVLGPDHPQTLSSQYTLATLIEKRGGFSEAERLHRLTLEARLRIFGEDHPDTLSSMTLLGFLLNHAGRYAEAEPLVRRALDVEKRVLGESHVDRLWTKNVLGEILRDSGRLDEAAAVFRELLAARRNVLGEDHRDTLWSTTNLALTLTGQGLHAEAERLARAALDSRERRLGASHADTAWSRIVLARVLLDRGVFDESEDQLRKCITALPVSHGRRTSATQMLGEVLTRKGRFKEAETTLLEVQEQTARDPDTPPPLARRIKESLVHLYEAWAVGEPQRGHDRQAADWRSRLDQSPAP